MRKKVVLRIIFNIAMSIHFEFTAGQRSFLIPSMMILIVFGSTMFYQLTPLSQSLHRSFLICLLFLGYLSVNPLYQLFSLRFESNSLVSLLFNNFYDISYFGRLTCVDLLL